MTLHVKDGATWKTAAPWVNDGGTWKAAKELWVKDGATWKRVFNALTVTVSPPSRATSGFAYVATFDYTVSIVGGTASSITWGVLNYSGAQPSVSSGQGTTSVSFIADLAAGALSTSGTIYCDVVVAGETHRRTATFSHTQ